MFSVKTKQKLSETKTSAFFRPRIGQRENCCSQLLTGKHPWLVSYSRFFFNHIFICIFFLVILWDEILACSKWNSCMLSYWIFVSCWFYFTILFIYPHYITMGKKKIKHSKINTKFDWHPLPKTEQWPIHLIWTTVPAVVAQIRSAQRRQRHHQVVTSSRCVEENHQCSYSCRLTHWRPLQKNRP